MTETTDIIQARYDRRVQASYDECDGEAAFVIADVSRDDAWLSVPSGAELALEAHR